MRKAHQHTQLAQATTVSIAPLVSIRRLEPPPVDTVDLNVQPASTQGWVKRAAPLALRAHMRKALALQAAQHALRCVL